MFRRLCHPVTLVVGVVVLLFVLYEVGARFFAYTADAYVMSDIIVISAEVDGPVSELSVQNNQRVVAGDLLLKIEQTPYALRVRNGEAALAQAKAELELAQDEVHAANAGIASAQAVLTNAQSQLARVKALSTDGFSTEASLDVATRDMGTASANLLMAQAGHSVAIRRVAAADATITANEAMLARARYELSKTTLAAPEAGRVAPFIIRQGDYLRPGTQVLAVVTERRRRVVANMTQRHLSRIRMGQSALVTLGSDPWVIHRGRVSGIASGVARSPKTPDVVPYVAPTTDWVRLPQRFPVEITLDDWPPGLGVFTGADARVLIWF